MATANLDWGAEADAEEKEVTNKVWIFESLRWVYSELLTNVNGA